MSSLVRVGYLVQFLVLKISYQFAQIFSPDHLNDFGTFCLLLKGVLHAVLSESVAKIHDICKFYNVERMTHYLILLLTSTELTLLVTQMTKKPGGKHLLFNSRQPFFNHQNTRNNREPDKKLIRYCMYAIIINVILVIVLNRNIFERICPSIKPSYKSRGRHEHDGCRTGFGFLPID